MQSLPIKMLQVLLGNVFIAPVSKSGAVCRGMLEVRLKLRRDPDSSRDHAHHCADLRAKSVDATDYDKGHLYFPLCEWLGLVDALAHHPT
jgi:hypothetical protein